MINSIKIDISELNDNKGEALIKNEEWIGYYNQFYEMNFTQISGGIKMHGFRKGNIPSILLEIKYPYLVEEANQKSILTVTQMAYLEIIKKYPKAKIENYKIDDETKNFILFFAIREDDQQKKEEEDETNNENEKNSKKKTKTPNKEEKIDEKQEKKTTSSKNMKKEESEKKEEQVEKVKKTISKKTK